MFFVRFFKNAESDNFRFAVYKCDACGHTEWVRANERTFQTRVRACPKCGAEGVDDARKELERQKAELEKDIQYKQQALDKVNVELEVLASRTPMREKVTNGQDI